MARQERLNVLDSFLHDCQEGSIDITNIIQTNTQSFVCLTDAQNENIADLKTRINVIQSLLSFYANVR
jgi:hypothetical protein